MKKYVQFKIKPDYIYFLLLFPFGSVKFINASFHENLMTLYTILQIIVMFIYLFILKKSSKDFSLITVLVLLYELSFLIPTLINGTLTARTFYLWSKEVTVIVFLTVLTAKLLRTNYTRTISSIYRILSFWIIVHVILALFSDILVLGIRTRFGDTYTVAIILLFIDLEIRKRKIDFYDFLFIVISGLYIFKEHISTMIILELLLVIIFMFHNFKPLKKIFKYNLLVPGTVILNFSILFLNIQNAFKWLIVDLLHEDITLNNRTIIWQQVFMDMTNYNIFFGRGIAEENTKDIPMSVYNSYGHITIGDRQAHNQLLSVLYWNGIVGLMIYIVMILFAGVNLKKCKSSKIVMYYTLGIFLICISMISELSAENISFFMFLSCIYYSSNINNEINTEAKGAQKIE